ncbi:rod shape-determining protein MreC [Candidatus Saganbacteria bacterium]|nr:rod shape-determining protein MreC [Candidatus Saganbacteria bacterium]
MTLRPYRQKNPLVLAVLLFLVAVVCSLPVFNKFNVLRTTAQIFIFPTQWLAVSVWRGVVAFPGRVVSLASLASQNARYQQELAQLKVEALILDELKNENEQLKTALNFSMKSARRFHLLTARIIGRSPEPWFSLVELDRGRINGVKLGQAVITVQGVVGQVVAVETLSCRVRLLIDPESRVAAADARSRDLGVLVGSAVSKLYLKYVAAGGDVRIGDKIVTAAISLNYPAGLPLGTVVHAAKKEHDLFYQVIVEPAVEFFRLEQVFILL